VSKLGPGEFERPVSNCNRACRLLTVISMLLVVVVVGSGVGCASPEATPTPTRPPTRVPTPSPTPVPPVTVELSDRVDSAGILLETVEVASGDGVAILHLAKGTKVLGASGQPLDSITISAGSPQAPPDDFYRYLSGLTYDFSPGGMSFDPPARLTMSYDPALLPSDVDETRPQIAYFDAAESAWTYLDVTVDLDAHRMSADINHLGAFSVVFDFYAPPVS
jgi:hypothetical protein